MGYITTRFPGVRYREHLVRKTKNGQADRYYTIRWQHWGKRYEESLGWASQGWSAERAHEIRSEIVRNIRTGNGPKSLGEMRLAAKQDLLEQETARIHEHLDTFTVGDLMEQYYLPHSQKTKRSYKDDESRARLHILPQLGLIPLRFLQKEDIRAMLDQVTSSGKAPATVRQVFALVRAACNHARQIEIDGHVLLPGENPALGIRLPKIDNARDRYLVRDEARGLVDAAREKHNPDLHDAIILALYAGLRMGEILRLQWSDIHLEHSMLTIRNESQRKPGGKVPLNATACRVLQARKERQGVSPSGMVFAVSGGALSRHALNHLFSTLVDKVGLNDGLEKTDRQHRIVFHSLRHTFASWLAINGTDIYRIKTLMRHKTIDMTMRYAHLIPDATRAAVDLLPALDGDDS